MKLLSSLVLAVAFAAACSLSGVSSVSPTPPLKGGETTVTETFSGTVGSSGSDLHSFDVKAVGQMVATLVSVAPPTFVGFRLGSFDGTVCHARFENDASGPGQVLSGTPVSTGAFCVEVFNTGGIPTGATVNYSVTVVHP